MRDYEEFPDSLSLNTLFYIGNPQVLTVETLKKLHDLNIAGKQFFSLERLIKGKENARVIFGPRELPANFPELNLVELEDYLDNDNLVSVGDEKKVNVNQALSWLIEPKNSKKTIVVTEGLRNLSVDPNQKVFIQAVLMPIEKQLFQTTLRVMVVDPDPIKRVELARNVDQIIKAATGLNKRSFSSNKHEDVFSEGRKFDSFKQRSLIPKEVAEFGLTADEVLSLV